MQTFGEYATWWLEHRPALRPSTRQLYAWLLRRHVLPALGPLRWDELTALRVRGWHAELAAAAAPTPTRQAYCLVRAICTTAVSDGLLAEQPCRVAGAGRTRKAPRRIPTLAQVEAVADAVPARYAALVRVAAWSGARWGELTALTLDRLDLETGLLRIDRQLLTLAGSLPVEAPPKSDAGIRSLHLPPHLLPGLRAHVAAHVPAGCPWLFPNGKGAPVRRDSFRSVWVRARERAGVPWLRFHDLRHFANTQAAAAGASTRELMARMGHATLEAALGYQHASLERDRAIAQALSRMTEP